MKGDGEIKTGIAIRPKNYAIKSFNVRKCGLLSKHNKYTRFTTKNLRKIDSLRLVYKTRPYGTPKLPLLLLLLF